MTSKLSFYNMVKEEFKHHVVSVFVVVLYFLGKLLFYHFEIQRIINYSGNYSGKMSYITNALNDSAVPSYSQMLPMIFIAAFLAAEYFSYLHSRKKSDFYMALPIGRVEKFAMGAIVSAGIFFVPFIIEKCFEVMFAFSTGYATLEYTKCLLANILCTVLAVVASWLTMALAMIMTGHLVIALIGFGALCSYVPFFLKELIPVYQELFFETFARSRVSEWWYYFSPVSLASGITAEYYEWTISEHMDYLIALIVFIIVMGVTCVVLYKKRPAEAAGRAMAFEKINWSIRFAVVLPLALYFGYFLSCFAVGNTRIWLVAGTIIGAILFHGIMESIFSFDIRGMLAEKRQLAVAVLICMGFVALFWNDVFKFDEYVPDEEDVESVEITFWSDGINFSSQLYSNRETNGISGKYVKVVLALADNLVQQMEELSETELNEEAASTVINMQTATYPAGDESSMGEIVLEYELKNGTWTSRRYEIDLEKQENVALLDLLFATEEFKDDFYELYEVESEEINEIYVGNSFKDERVILSAQEQAKFVEIYKKELTNISYSQMSEFDKWARLTFTYDEMGMEECYIYSGFEETIEYLFECGYEIKPPFSEYEIVSLTIEKEYVDKKTDSFYVSEHVIRDTELLESIKEELLLEEFYGGYVYGVNGAKYAVVDMRINGVLQSASVQIRPETLEKLNDAIE